MKIEEIEKNLNTLRKIKLNKTAEKQYQIKDYKKAIDLAITGESTVMDHGKGCQCGPDRLRGIADLYRLSRHYTPNVKLGDVVQYINEKTNSGKFRNSFCGTTNQTVYQLNVDSVPSYYSSIDPRVRLNNRKWVVIEK